MKNIAIIILSFLVVSTTFGQSNTARECFPPIEEFSNNNSNKEDKNKEKHSFKSDIFFGFEESFKDTISIIVENKLILKKYMESDENGRADRVKVNVKPQKKVVIKTAKGDCTQFYLKKDYNYLYIRRSYEGQWLITYSNYNRVYW